MHSPGELVSQLHGADVVLDALLGYSLDGPPRELEAGLIRTADSHGVPVISLDLPSGLDPARGVPYDPDHPRHTTSQWPRVPTSGSVRPRPSVC